MRLQPIRTSQIPHSNKEIVILSSKYAKIIWSKDLEEYANKFLPRKWSLAQGEDFPSQDSIVFVDIPDIDRLEESEEDGNDLQRWFAGGNYMLDFSDDPNCFTIMSWLYTNGLLDRGHYGIHIFW